MQSRATFMISVNTFKSPVFKKNIEQFHITLRVQLLASALSFFYLSNAPVSAKWKTSQMHANKRKTFFLSIKEYQTQAILALFCCRTVTARVMARFAPESIAHPAGSWVPWLLKKYLTAVQRDVVPSTRTNGNLLRTTEMPSARHIPSSSCSRDQLSPVWAICTYWDFMLQ